MEKRVSLAVALEFLPSTGCSCRSAVHRPHFASAQRKWKVGLLPAELPLWRKNPRLFQIHYSPTLKPDRCDWVGSQPKNIERTLRNHVTFARLADLFLRATAGSIQSLGSARISWPQPVTGSPLRDLIHFTRMTALTRQIHSPFHVYFSLDFKFLFIHALISATLRTKSWDSSTLCPEP